MSLPVSDVFDAINQGSVVVVSSSDTHALTSDDETRLRTLITNTDRLARLDAPGEPPALCLRSAYWAAQTLHFLCRTLLDRIETGTELPPDLVASQPAGRTADEHWSVDLVFRVLADVDRRCAGANQLDPLRKTIADLARKWPLSAVGISGESTADSMKVVLSHTSLHRIMVDRIVTRGDTERAKLPCFADAIAATAPTVIPDV
ncbi:hypothetical protein [Aporhodopirellula aestuarii]|uniref:MoxR-vWA-beta-propeller ternary system domain-containing protein n=1 Tax=Aporhodopirellula aestuarii TaxID=2950107 RepID=A0ABT0U5Y4_9BACT|nr:hypothetical protein [Aporhodopirellula aestuarii]MCM2372357.1 hypothetical protein [Aporhodopirellula aestuarii]